MSQTKRQAHQANAVVRKLEAGNGNIKGMKLLLPVDREALVPVEVIGISFGGYAHGVCVLVHPIGGAGTTAVEATSLVDDTPEARAVYQARSRAACYLRDKEPKNSASPRSWRAAVDSERSMMTAAQRTRFDALAPKHFRDGLDMAAGLKESEEYKLKTLYREAVAIRHDADSETIESDR